MEDTVDNSRCRDRLAHHIFDISRIVPSEENKSSEETINKHSNGSDTKTDGISPSSPEIGLELGKEEEGKLFFGKLGGRN